MLELHFNSEALAALEKALERVPGIAYDELRGAMERSVLVIESEVRQRTPTSKTTTGGRLRGGIASRIEPLGRWWRGIVEIANVAYALFVEEDTRPHDIYPKRGKALVFTPIAGFRLAYRDTSTGRTVGKRRAMEMGAAGKAGLLHVERGRALFATAKGKTTTNRANAAQVLVQHVHHPGTKGYHMFRDGAMAAWPQVERIFRAALARVAKRMS